MKTIINHKTKIITGSVALFALAIILVGLNFGSHKAQACATDCFPPLNGYCEVNVSQANIGETVTFTGTGTGGTGYYAYAWSGTDGLTGNDYMTSKSYSTSGTKTATVTIGSNGQIVQKSCSVFIRQPPVVNNLYVSCAASPSQADIGQNVNFTSNVSGGNGSYTYSWSGDDGLSGNNSNVSKSYTTSGTKNATITVTSDGQTKSATCSTHIREEQIINLDGFCEGRPSTIDVDERVTWTAYPTGGNGSYQYDWSGDDGLNGSNKSITKTYSDSGTKDATVRITSDGQSITRSCDIRVRQEENNDLDAYCVANPSHVDINLPVTFTVYPSGLNSGSYRYSWSGTDGLNGSGKSVTHSYSNEGSKTATVRVSIRNSNGNNDDEVTATCHTNVNGPTVLYVPPQPPPQGGVYLDTIPATGLSTNVKNALFTSGIIIWSSFLGYLLIKRRNLKLKHEKMIEDANNS